MILEEETYKKFGYYPCYLKPKSNKKILAICEECGKIREIEKKGHHALCGSCSQKGRRNNNYGKSFPDTTRRKMSIAKKGEKNYSWKGGKIKRTCEFCGVSFYAERCQIRRQQGKYCSTSCALKALRHKKRPRMTHPERIFEEICTKYSLPFHFVGDGKIWIGNLNPDFIHNTRKLCIEIFGDYWHSPLLNKNILYNQTLEGRRKQLKAKGYKLIVFWESDLKRKDVEAFVLTLLYREKGIRFRA